MCSEQDAERAIELYADTVKRICMVHLKNYSDTQDVFQDVFIKYVLRSHPFESAEHEKAWIIRVTINACRDLIKSFFRSRTVSLDGFTDFPEKSGDENRNVVAAVLSLPEKYKDAVYLHYFEGYTAPEIGSIIGKNVNTVYTLLSRARLMLKEHLGGEDI